MKQKFSSYSLRNAPRATRILSAIELLIVTEVITTTLTCFFIFKKDLHIRSESESFVRSTVLVQKRIKWSSVPEFSYNRYHIGKGILQLRVLLIKIGGFNLPLLNHHHHLNSNHLVHPMLLDYLGEL